jgi:hypothetical protein
MLTALNLNLDGVDAAKDISVVSNTLSGGCTTWMTGTMNGPPDVDWRPPGDPASP